MDPLGFDKTNQTNRTALHNGSGDLKDATRLDAVSYLLTCEACQVTEVCGGGTEC